VALYPIMFANPTAVAEATFSREICMSPLKP
jgi:hypothetical protein